MTPVRIFFIVAAAVLFANWITSGLERLGRRVTRQTEKAAGMTEQEYEDSWNENHPNSWLPLLPLLWTALVGIGFLWAIFSR